METNNKLTIKQKISIHLILLIIQILKPFDYEHQYTAAIKEIKEMLNNRNYE